MTLTTTPSPTATPPILTQHRSRPDTPHRRSHARPSRRPWSPLRYLAPALGLSPQRSEPLSTTAHTHAVADPKVRNHDPSAQPHPCHSTISTGGAEARSATFGRPDRSGRANSGTGHGPTPFLTSTNNVTSCLPGRTTFAHSVLQILSVFECLLDTIGRIHYIVVQGGGK
jgi:hypothetical protein